MSIWFDKVVSVEKLKPIGKNTMAEWIGIEWIEIGKDFLKAKMPVDHRTTQDFGILHGGASCVLAETIGSIASYMVIDSSKFYCAGLEINANHIRMIREGFVIGMATPLHLGNSTHVWDIRISDEKDKLICISRLTVAILTRKD